MELVWFQFTRQAMVQRQREREGAINDLAPVVMMGHLVWGFIDPL